MAEARNLVMDHAASLKNPAKLVFNNNNGVLLLTDKKDNLISEKHYSEDVSDEPSIAEKNIFVSVTNGIDHKLFISKMKGS